MVLAVADRVRETTTTTGTGTITLAGAVTGYQSFSAIGNGNVTYYTISLGSQWEVGIGTYLGAGPTLSRDTVLESSNANALVNFSAGTKEVFITYPAAKAVYQNGSVIVAGSAVLGIANGGTNATTAANALTSLGAYAASNPNGYTSNTGTVTSVAATGTVSGITLTGSITTSGTITLGGTLALTSGQVTTALGFTPYNDTNPAGYTTNTGTVTSVGGTGTVSGLSLSGTVTTTGNLTLGGTLAVTASNFASQLANTFLAAPNGVAGIPTFRTIVAADVPTLNQNTTGTASNVTGVVAIANGGTGQTTAPLARTALGATTVGSNFFTLTNPTAITFPRINADNTVSTLDAATFRTAIGAGTGTVTAVTGTAPIASSGGTAPAISISAATTVAAGSMSAADKTKLDGIAANANNYVLPKATATALGGVELFDATVQSVAANLVSTTAGRTYGVQFNAADQMVVNVPWVDTNSGGTVTSVGGTGTVSGLTLSGTVTTTGNLTLGGTLSLTSLNVTTALGFTPYNATNPAGYISANQTITLSGDVTGSGTTAITTTLANSGVTAGTYNSVTVNAKGIVTGGTAKEIPNVQSVTSSATVTPNADTNDLVSINAQAVALTIAAPTGTSTDGEKLIIRIKDNGTTQTINWNGVYAAGGATLPTATVAGKWHHVGLIYNVNTTTWLCVAATVQA